MYLEKRPRSTSRIGVNTNETLIQRMIDTQSDGERSNLTDSARGAPTQGRNVKPNSSYLGSSHDQTLIVMNEVEEAMF